jgi:hypothetical protein
MFGHCLKVWHTIKNKKFKSHPRRNLSDNNHLINSPKQKDTPINK